MHISSLVYFHDMTAFSRTSYIDYIIIVQFVI